MTETWSKSSCPSRAWWGRPISGGDRVGRGGGADSSRSRGGSLGRRRLLRDAASISSELNGAPWAACCMLGVKIRGAPGSGAPRLQWHSLAWRTKAGGAPGRGGQRMSAAPSPPPPGSHPLRWAASVAGSASGSRSGGIISDSAQGGRWGMGRSAPQTGGRACAHYRFGFRRQCALTFTDLPAIVTSPLYCHRLGSPRRALRHSRD